VARVYRELEQAGILVTARGRGTFVADRPKVQPGTRDRRLRSLCASFIGTCGKAGFSLEEVREALDAIARKELRP
jgi:GntR family transcriptional regulator